MKYFSLAIVTLLVFTAPAFAAVDISSPSNGEHVSSPFTLSASSSNCSSQAVRTLGYSIDSGDVTMVQDSSNWSTASMDVKVSASEGTHTVHVMTWGQQGSACASDVQIDVTNVTDDVSSNTSLVPSNAISNSSLQKLGNWTAVHDSGTSGSSKGYMSLVGSPAHSGSSRKFSTTYKNSGGERYAVTFGDDRTHQNFLWDGWVYFTSTSSKIASLEMDLDQTMTNGQTVVFGFQCSGNSGTWDYSANKGTASHPKGTWVRSKFACNPRTWKRYVWHHVQISYSRTTGGHITYKAVYLDGVKKTLDVTVYGARDLGWGSGLTINFQVDGLGSSGSNTVYLSDLTLKRW
jgi:hypothetical protein